MDELSNAIIRKYQQELEAIEEVLERIEADPDSAAPGQKERLESERERLIKLIKQIRLLSI